MSIASDNLIALTVLRKLVVPFRNTDAYRLGIIDLQGKVIKKPKTFQEKSSLTKLDLLAFNLKKLLAKIPGGSSMTASIVGALYLIKEGVSEDYDILNHKLIEVLEAMDSGVRFIEEEKALASILEEDESIAEFINEDAPVASGGSGVALGAIAGANTGTIAGADSVLGAKPKKTKVMKRKKKPTNS